MAEHFGSNATEQARRPVPRGGLRWACWQVLFFGFSALPLAAQQRQMPQQQGPPLQPLPHPEIPDPVQVLPGPAWWVFAVGGLLVVILLALIIWLLLRPAQAAPQAVRRPWQTAMDGLRELAARSGTTLPASFAAEVSEVLRRYFFDRYKIPAPFRTTREIFTPDAAGMGAARVQRYMPLAQVWDQIAFAPVMTTKEECDLLVNKAIACLEEDRP